MAAGELAVYGGDSGFQVIHALTDVSTNDARAEGIEKIEPDPDAIRYIAKEVGKSLPGFKLPNGLVVVTRYSGPGGGRIDSKLPKDRSELDPGRFFPGVHLGEKYPSSVDRSDLVELARGVGAPALTEVSIPSWRDTTSHPGDVAAGLVLGQCPLDLPPAPSLLGKARAFVDEARGEVFEGRNTKALTAIGAIRRDKSMPQPFIITRKSGS